MRKNILSVIAAVLTTLVLTIIFQPLSYLQALGQQGSCQIFPQTNKAVCGKFLAFWQQHGGLTVFGYPISNEFTETVDVNGNVQTLGMQYFERARFEYHTENDPPYDVQLGRVGEFEYKARYPDGNILGGDLPLYPNAQALNIRQAKGEPDDLITTFQTTDNPQSVLAFYKDVLTKEGWVADIDEPDALRLAYNTDPGNTRCANSSNPLCPPATVYGVSVKTTMLSGGLTSVQLYYTVESPM